MYYLYIFIISIIGMYYFYILFLLYNSNVLHVSVHFHYVYSNNALFDLLLHQPISE